MNNNRVYNNRVILGEYGVSIGYLAGMITGIAIAPPTGGVIGGIAGGAIGGIAGSAIGSVLDNRLRRLSPHSSKKAFSMMRQSGGDLDEIQPENMQRR